MLFLARVPHRAPPSPVPGQLGCFGVGDRQQLLECLTPPLGRVSALLGWECIYNMFCFLCQRQSVRNMVWVSIFLGAFPEKCNIWPLAQGSRAAPVSRAAAGSCVRPRKMLLWQFWWDRKDKQGLVSVSGCKLFSMILCPSSRAEWLACVLGTLPLQAVEILMEVDASTAAFLLFFFSLPYFLVLHIDAGTEWASGESRKVLQKDCSLSHLS